MLRFDEGGDGYSTLIRRPAPLQVAPEGHKMKRGPESFRLPVRLSSTFIILYTVVTASCCPPGSVK
jgi:hypothetical protein